MSRRRRAELEDAEAVVVASRATPGGVSRPRLHDRHVVAPRAQPARQLVGAPAAAAADRRKRVGRDQDPHRAVRDGPRVRDRRLRAPGSAPPSCSRAPRARAPPRPAAAAARRSLPAHASASASASAAGDGMVEQTPSRPSADERRDPSHRGRDHRQPRGHVLEDLQRRPVEPERQRRVRADVERRDADVGAGERRRHPVVRQRAGEDDRVDPVGGLARRAAAPGRRR